MTALVLLGLGAVVLIQVLAKYTGRPLTMSTAWLRTLHHQKDGHD